MLRETGMSPQQLTVEITESYAMQNVDYAIGILKMLKEMGLKVALDDFGIGYSSLSYLKRFPIDMLKIDRTFVKGVPEAREDTAIIAAIIALAHSMGMKVIAEGVEDKKQLLFLHSLGCDEIQGFYFSRPQPAAKIQKLLEKGARLPGYV